jgi:hypothetical protein
MCRTVLACLLATLAVAARALAHPDPRPAGGPPGAIALAGPRALLLGDSLAVGIDRLLRDRLGGWRLSTDARVGRRLAEGMRALDAHRPPRVLAVSLFTNDDPRRVGSLSAAVRRALDRVGPRGCVVWSTIVRPPVGGVTYRRANDRLIALARRRPERLKIVPWAARIRRHRRWLGPDRVHPTVYGYQRRAALYAVAMRSCLAE